MLTEGLDRLGAALDEYAQASGQSSATSG
jgi:hypothetical protein